MSIALPIPVLWTLTGVYGLLILSSGVAAIFTVRRPGKDHSELNQRIQSWWVIVTVFTLTLILNRTVAILFFALLSFLALREYLSLIPTRLADRRVLLWAYLAIVVQYFWIYIGWYGMFLIFIPIYMFLFLSMQMMLTGDTKGFLNAIGTLHWGLMLTVYTMSHPPYLYLRPDGPVPSVHG